MVFEHGQNAMLLTCYLILKLLENVVFFSIRYSLKIQPIERMHLAVVACGERLEETITMLKSAIIFSIKPLQFHIFAEDQLHDSFKGIVSI